MKLQAFDSSYFYGKTHFQDDGAQSYFVFKPVYRYFTTTSNNKIQVKFTENVDLDKYKYFSYGIGFDALGNFSLSDGSRFGKNFIFGADMSSSVHIERYLYFW